MFVRQKVDDKYDYFKIQANVFVHVTIFLLIHYLIQFRLIIYFVIYVIVIRISPKEYEIATSSKNISSTQEHEIVSE